MSKEVTTTKKTVLELDGFNAFTNEIEGDDNVNTEARSSKVRSSSFSTHIG